jgi:hypothetical protein
MRISLLGNFRYAAKAIIDPGNPNIRILRILRTKTFLNLVLSQAITRQQQYSQKAT